MSWPGNGIRTEGYKDKIHRIQVKIKDHPELIVRSRQRIGGPPRAVAASVSPVSTGATPDPATTAAADKQIVDIIKSPYPKKGLPLSVYAAYAKAADHSQLAVVSLKIPGGIIETKESNNKLTGDVTLFGVFFNDRGKQISSFKEKMPISQTVSAGETPILPDLVFSQAVKLSPGLYQVRVVARDNLSNLTGAAQEWIDIPELSGKHLSISTPFIGEVDQNADSQNTTGTTFKDFSLKIDKDFSRSSNLRFITYIYNPDTSQAAGAPANLARNLFGEARILHNNKPVAASQPRSISTPDAKAADHLTYVSELPLKGLPSGSYTLEVTVTDSSTNARTTQELNFTIR